MNEAVVVLVTTPAHEAEAAALALVEPKLAACVNIVPSVRSFYWWDGKLHDDAESLLVVKTTRARVDAVVEKLDGIVEYDVVEVVALDVTGGNPRYLDWLVATVGS